MMTYDEVNLAKKILGLKKTSLFATRNYLKENLNDYKCLLSSLQNKGFVQKFGNGYELNRDGIDQLRLQIGEFYFKKQEL